MKTRARFSEEEFCGAKYQNTVWIFHDFSIYQILRETQVGDFIGPKTAILAL